MVITRRYISDIQWRKLTTITNSDTYWWSKENFNRQMAHIEVEEGSGTTENFIT